MSKDSFGEKKRLLIERINTYLSDADIAESDKTSLNRVLEILSLYNFENRLTIKGLLSHAVVDSLQLDYSIGEYIVKFDRNIT